MVILCFLIVASKIKAGSICTHRNRSFRIIAIAKVTTLAQRAVGIDRAKEGIRVPVRVQREIKV